MIIIDRTYVENIIGPGTVSGSLAYGGTTTSAISDASFAQFASGSSATVLSALFTAGVRMSDDASPPEDLKRIAGLHCVMSLYNKALIDVSDFLLAELVDATNNLDKIRNGEMKIVGTVPISNASPVQGGYSITNAGSTAKTYNQRVFSKKNLFDAGF